jgi:hypothetical protein
VINGLSDHDAQLLIIKNIKSISNYHNHRRIRCINNDTIKEFITHLSNENWDSVLNGHDIDSKFNTFLNIFLRLFEASFPTKTQKKVFENNEGITKGIKTSCRFKRDLYLNCRSSDNQIMKIHYRKYCRILTQVIKEAKHMHYNKQLLELDNKVKVVWKIVKKETGKVSKEDVTPINKNKR